MMQREFGYIYSIADFLVKQIISEQKTGGEEIVSPFLNRVTSIDRLLTPREIDVGTLVREGRTGKEIAEVLNISVSGVDFHHKKIRKKLNLANTQSNLRSYLLSLG